MAGDKRFFSLYIRLSDHYLVTPLGFGFCKVPHLRPQSFCRWCGCVFIEAGQAKAGGDSDRRGL